VNDEDITFDSGGVTLAGSFRDVASPVAAALLISGSGRTDRNSDVRLGLVRLRSGITRAVADALAGVQVCSLRYDKRGVGASGGDTLAVGMADRLADAEAALAWLGRRCPELPLLAIGHSEGAYYAARLAADGLVAGAALLSGSVRTGAEINAWQAKQIASRLPRSTRLVLRALHIDVVKAQRRNQEKIMSSSADVMRLQGTKVNARWVRDFVRYDPAPVLSRVSVPVLALTGGHDIQVPPEDIEAMGKLVQGPFEGQVVGDLSHMLRPDPDWIGLRGYRRQLRQPTSHEVLALIAGWVTGHWGQP
jgi:uncharacterized protein